MKQILYVIIALSPAVFFSCEPLLYSSLEISAQDIDRVSPLIDQVNESRMIDTLTDLTGPRHFLEPQGLSLDYFQSEITDRLIASGLSPYTQEVTIDSPWYSTIDAKGNFVEHTSNQSYSMNNIIAEQTGTNPDLPPVLLTSHWDTVYSTPGINDNGSGVTACLEAAEIFSNYTFERTILYCFFAFEEEGMHGSKLFADTMKTLPEMVYNMDMISFTSEKQNAIPGLDLFMDWPTRGDFIAIVASSFSLTEALDFCSVIDTFVPELPYRLLVADENINNNIALWNVLTSDQKPFWGKGVPAIAVIDTSYLREGSAMHRPGDTLDSIDPELMVNTTKAVLAAAALRAGI